MTHPFRYNPNKAQKPMRGTMLNPSHQLSRGLIGGYILNEGLGRYVNDYSGNGNNGIVKNIATGFMADTVGPVFDFDNTTYDDTGHIDLGAMNVPPNTSQMTVVTKVYLDNIWGDLDYNDLRIVSKQKTVSEADHYWMLGTIDPSGLGLMPCRIRVRLKTAGTTHTFVTSANIVGTGYWMQLAFVYNGSTVTLYKDAIPYALTGSAAKSGIVSTTTDTAYPAFIGNGWDTGGYGYYGAVDGRIEYVYIYARALSSHELGWLNREPYAMFGVS